eukprot:TRINITY_DN3689_c0_g2_i9.p1 TRINITY_DN3689_c0_g2~~TRINITY_DN3689_c0_g2_i9.p1  ORF type:complete len:146 (-),score=39.43 TRINITY_DN3689_c0_g2_i9:81-518(-)
MFLRLTLSFIFISSGIFTYLNPTSTGDYIDSHYKTLYDEYIAKTPAEEYLPESFVQTDNKVEVVVVAAGLGLTGLFALLGLGKLFKTCGVLLAVLAILLHIPNISKDRDVAGNVRKLLFIGALLCGIIAYKGPQKPKEDIDFECM